MQNLFKFDFGIRTILMFFLAVFASTMALVPAQAQSLPQDHSRWIGDIEGDAVDEQQSALVYELNFLEDGNVEITKHTKNDKYVQVFDWQAEGEDIAIVGDEEGPVGELAGQTLVKKGTRYYFQHYDGETDIELKKSVQWISWTNIAFLFALLLIGNEVARHFKIAPYLIFFLLPVVLTPLWLESDLGWFRIVKVYSALAGAVFFTLFRFNFNLKEMGWAKAGVALILAVNIFEAVLQDWSQGTLVNQLNAFAGFLNLITIYLWSTIRADDKKPHDMLWPGMTVGWILAYDIWNVTFVYLNFPNTVAYTFFAVLMAPTLAALFIKKGSWLQARAYTLAIYMMYICSTAAFNFDVTLIEPLPRNMTIVWALVGTSVAINVGYAALHFWYRFTGKAPKNIQVGQNLSVID